MTSRRTVSRLLLGLVATAGLLGIGCGSRPGTISGEVKYNGQPIPSGTITFLSQAGKHQVAAANIVAGKYTVKGLEPGPAKVTVVTLPPARGGLPPTGRPIDAPSPTTLPGRYMPINKKYANPDQSGLTHDVRPGAQEKNFDLAR